MSQTSIAIIGAGIAGACLAQALIGRGIDVTVYERNPLRSHFPKGFWIEIDSVGLSALRSCLLPSHFADLLARSRPTNRPDCRWLPRAELQRCLLLHLDGIVRFDKPFEYYQITAEQVISHFSDGTSAASELLVGADGINSKVRRQLLPNAQHRDTGVFAIGATATLNTAIAGFLPPKTFDHPIAITGPKNHQFFIAVWQATNPEQDQYTSAEASRIQGEAAEFRTGEYVMIRFSAPVEAYNPHQSLHSQASGGLKQATIEMMEAWPQNLRFLVDSFESGSFFLLPIKTSCPLDNWTTGRVSLIGDAIHAMAPHGGFGANVAMRDASVLGSNLLSAIQLNEPILEAISDYETKMIRYGFDAVRRAADILRQANGIAYDILS